MTWRWRGPSTVRIAAPPSPAPPVYLSILAFLIALVVGIGTWLLGAGWFGGSFFGFVAFAATWILGVRRISRRLQPLFEQAQRQVQSGKAQLAIATLQSILPLGKWMPLLTGQIYAQLGFLEHQAGDQEQAIEYLQKAGKRAADARVLLASLMAQNGKKADAFKLLAASQPWNRKHVLLHNVYAWLLDREGKRDEAIHVLGQLLLKTSDQATSDNRLRLQNDKKMTMTSFGAMWYMLGFESPPASMGQLRPTRKGFRQPPKRRG